MVVIFYNQSKINFQMRSEERRVGKECLLKHFGRFGAPYQLRSDNGPHFIAEVIREFLHLIGVSHTVLH